MEVVVQAVSAGNVFKFDKGFNPAFTTRAFARAAAGSVDL
jgi:hypothetical protein